MFNVFGKSNDVVKLVDYRMGSYKSTRILEWMDKHPNKRYMYVSPLLTEVDVGGRVHQNLKNITLEVPTNDDCNKSESLLNMLRNGDSIACTHSLYLSMTDAHFHEIAIRDYTLVLDEEVNVIDGFDKYSDNDLKWLLEKGDISISKDDGMVEWVGNRENIVENHKYYEFLKYCDSKSLYSTKRSETMMVTQLPIKLFEVAKEVIILTYMFDGNVLDCFLKLKGFKIEKFTEIDCCVTDKQKIRDLITLIPPTTKLKDYSMSSTWWSEANAKQINDVANFIRTNALNYGLKNDDVCWTAPKSRSVKQSGQKKNLLKPRGFIQDSDGNPCYLAANVRATNKLAHKKGMFHCYNRRPLVSVSSYLEDYNCKVDLQVFATSEMVQWLWRGCIRNDEPMIVGIANKRMYNYFVEWLESDL